MMTTYETVQQEIDKADSIKDYDAADKMMYGMDVSAGDALTYVTERMEIEPEFTRTMERFPEKLTDAELGIVILSTLNYMVHTRFSWFYVLWTLVWGLIFLPLGIAYAIYRTCIVKSNSKKFKYLHKELANRISRT